MWPSFLNVGLFYGLAAAAVPVAIHLLSKRRYRQTDWAAMHLLLEAVRRSSRRMQLEQLLLLSLRTLLILLVALAMMQPVYESSARAPSSVGPRTLRMIVVDGSFSMAYRVDGGEALFERAKRIAAEIVEQGTLGDGFTLTLLAEPPREVVREPSFESGDMVDQIRRLQQPHGRGSPQALFDLLVDRAARHRREHPDLAATEIYLVSDLGRSTWLSEPLPQALRDRLSALGQSAGIHVVDVGLDHLENAAVVDLRLGRQYAVTAESAALEYRLANFGKRGLTAKKLSLFVDGQLAGERTVDLPPQSETAGVFTHRFPTPGDHAVEVRLQPDDLPLDDSRFLAVPVKTSVDVLLVDGEPAGGEATPPVEYLRQALAPSAGGAGAAAGGVAGAIRPTVALENALVENADLDQYDCIFLCHVHRFSEPEALRLDRYVRAGGGLVFLLGDRVQPDSYNRWLSGDDPRGSKLLPVRIGAPQTIPPASPPGRPNPLGYRHELLSLFRGNERSGLTLVPIRKYFKLEPPTGREAASREALRLDDSAPLLVEARVDLGRVVVLAAGVDPATGFSPKSFVFLPLVHEILKFAARDAGRSQNVLVGALVAGQIERSPVDSPWKERGVLSEPPPADEPAGSRSGFFVCDFAAPQPHSGLLAVSVDPRESDLAKLDRAALESELLAGVRFSYWNQRPDAAPSAASLGPRRDGLYRWLLYAALAALFLETFLAWKLGYHSA